MSRANERDDRREAHRDKLDEAERALAGGDRDAAIACLEQAARLDEHDDESPMLAAMLLFDRGELARAARLAGTALTRRPYHPTAVNLLGTACLDAGHATTAAKVLRQATRMAPGLRAARNNLERARRAPSGGGAVAQEVQEFPLELVRESMRPAPPRLTVCIVVDDDGPPPTECETALGDLADEIVVVVARETAPGTNPHHEPEPAVEPGPAIDRAARWNAGVHRATGDWVLVLHSHERLRLDDPTGWRTRLGRPGVLALAVEVHETNGGRRRELRLFRNAPEVRFLGEAAPTAHPSIRDLARRWKLRVDSADLVVEQGREAGHWARDHLAALCAAAPRDTLEPCEALVRARHTLAEGEVERALDIVVQARDALRAARALHADELEELVTLEGRCLLRLGRFDELGRIVREYHRKSRPTDNTRYLEAVSARAVGHAKQARRILVGYRTRRVEASFVSTFPEVLGPDLPNLLAGVCMDAGDTAEAGRAFEEALGRDPSNVEATMGRLGLRLVAGQLEELLRDLDRAVETRGDDPRLWFFGGELLGRVPRLAPTAREWMEEACRRFPEHEDLRRALAEARLRCGFVDEALEAWSDTSSGGSPADVAGRFVACLTTGAELPAVPSEQRGAVEQVVLRRLEDWMACGVFETLDRALVELPRAEAALPGLGARTAEWLRAIGQTEAASRLDAVAQS